jgi:cytochrome P450
MHNIHAFHMDKEYWKNPDVFEPERFTGSGAKEQFIPFGFGTRVCMGESLAKAELFLFTTLLLQNINIGIPKHNRTPDPQESIAGVTRVPKPFHVNVTCR